MNESRFFTRRQALAAAAGVASVVLARPGAAATGPRTSPAAAPEPAGDALGLVPGLAVGRCSVVRCGPLRAGSLPVELRDPGGRVFAVDLLRHDAATPGVARARSIGVYLRNGGRGSAATVEEHGLGAMALARLLAKREAAGVKLPRLATLREHAALIENADRCPPR